MEARVLYRQNGPVALIVIVINYTIGLTGIVGKDILSQKDRLSSGDNRKLARAGR